MTSKIVCPVCGKDPGAPEELREEMKFDCGSCDAQLFVESLDPLTLIQLAKDRIDSARGDLYADHGGQYTLQELIADIIDNSIDATDGGTCNVVVDSSNATTPRKKGMGGLQGPDQPFVIIEDDAKGMSQETLDRAMGKGNRRGYKPYELGHYGVGLKKSSLSSAYEITVFTKEKGGEILCARYSSCYIEKFDHNGIMDEAEAGKKFPWMVEAESWSNAKERLEQKESGTVILLEGLPNLIDETRDWKEDDDDALDAHIEETSAYLGLIFGKYLDPKGCTLDYFCPDDQVYKEVTKKINIICDEDDVLPLDPFHKDLQDKENNFGTLHDYDHAKTHISGRREDIDVDIWIIPNSEHPDFKEEVGKTLDRLKMTRKSASPESLQGCYVYRNGRLVDYGKEGRWKGAYGNNSNPKHTAYRWEVNLPVDVSLGSRDHSDWEIDTSKSEATPNHTIKSQFKKIAAKQRRFHENDPEYKMAAGVRATKRREKTGNGTQLLDHKRWPVCKLCKEIGEESTGWRHKAADHKCTKCGKKGHEGPYKSDLTPNKKCGQYVPRPSGGGPPPPNKPDTPKEGGGKGDTGKDPVHVPVVSEVSEQDSPISVKKEDSKLMIRVDMDHNDIDEVMRQISPYVDKWKKKKEEEE